MSRGGEGLDGGLVGGGDGRWEMREENCSRFGEGCLVGPGLGLRGL